jgi:hypothetical protein
VISSFLRGEPEAKAKTASSLGYTPFAFVISFLSDSNRDSITALFYVKQAEVFLPTGS